MRAIPIVALLLVATLAGCTGPAQLPAVDPDSIAVPGGALKMALPDGVQLVWPAVKLPFVQTFSIPQGATMVRVTAFAGDTKAVNIALVNNDTLRRRCNNPTQLDFDHPILGEKTCSGLTAVDGPGAVWRATVTSPALDGIPVLASVKLQFLDAPLDGLVATLDLGRLSKPTHTLKPTATQFVPSFDGVKLRVEVTVPEGPGPWPTIIESSPYHDDGVRANPASYAYFVEDWAKRGYAIAVADVRGFGDSGGCVEVWGPNEQRDQAFLVEWAAQQPWSNGHVGFYGQSYVATTPVEAAVQAPPHLDAIIAVAPVIRNYDDWHYGGVGNGENVLSPVEYDVGVDATTGYPFSYAVGAAGSALGGNPPALPNPGAIPPPRGDPFQDLNNLGNGLCDPADAARPNDPRALYDAYYVERDFAARAGNVKAAVLYTHGFEDANVKAQMIPDWFDAIPSKKLGLFGHWLHQHPPRMDSEALMVGWMDQYVKGIDLGFGKLPNSDVVVDASHHRSGATWPPQGTTATTLFPAFGDNKLGPASGGGSASLTLDASGGALPVVSGDLDARKLAYHTPEPLAQPLALAGNAVVHVKGTLTGASNGYLAAALYEDTDTQSHLLTWGQVNLAHNADHTVYTPIAPGQLVTTDLPMRPTEHIVAAGSRLRLELTGVTGADALDPYGAGGLRFTFQGGADGTALVLPTLDVAAYEALPLTASS